MFLVARYFECPIQCFSAAFDVLIKISKSYRPQIPTVFKRHGGDSLGMGHGFKSATNRLDFSTNFASRVPRFSPRFLPRSRHDWAAIGRQSCCSSFVDRLPIDGRRIRSGPAPSLLDRGSIAPRSWSSSTIVHRRSITPQVNEWLRSRDRVVHDFDERPPSDRVDRGDDRDRNALRLMKIQRSRIVHVAQGRPCDYFTDDLFFCTCLIWRSRGLGSTRPPPL